jgi:UDP-N-acetylmuramoyl-tripeptide--D-alanyl-D-alanine ligase
MSDDTELLVIEFGMDRPGDLTKLSTMIHPDIAVLTMIGEAHIEFFKTRDRIADGKMEIVNGLNPDGVLVYNGDEPLLVDRVGAQDTLKGTTFGLNPRNDLFATEIELHTESASFKTSVAEARFSIPLSGRYNIANALAAISVGRLLGISFEDMANALSAADITQNRTEWLTASNGARILSDVYNSNPTAAKEVLAMFSQVPTTGKRLVVLGDMLELGEAGPELHASLADSLNLGAIAEVFLVGDIMRNLGDRLHAKFQPEHIHQFAKTDLDPLAEAISKTLQPEDIILLKGSHGIHLEGIVSVLVG